MVGGNETPAGLSGQRACAGAHGVSRMHGDDGRSDCGDLCAAWRTEQCRHAAEHHAVLRDRAGGGSRCRAAGAGVVHARRRCTPRRSGRRRRARSFRKCSAICPNPTYKFISRLNEDMFAGTPYAHDPLGTRPSFDATTGEMLSNVLQAVVHAEQCDPGDRRRCRSGDDAGEGEGAVRRHQGPSAAGAACRSRWER